MDDKIKLIETIGKQYPFLITVFSIIVFIIKWKAIWMAIGNLKKIKIKAPGTEVELSTSPEEKLQAYAVEVQKPKEIVEQKIEDEAHSLFDIYSYIEKGDMTTADQMFEKIQNESTPEEKVENRIIYEYYRFLNGASDAIKSIHDILEESNLSIHNKYLVYFYLGTSYKTGKNINKAIENFSKAYEFVSNENEHTSVLLNIAQTYSQNNEIEGAIQTLIDYYPSLKETDPKIKVLNELADLFKIKEDKISRIACLELAADLSVNDALVLFNLAYTYSQADFENASIFNYLKAVYFKPDYSYALNNLGVSYRNKELKLNSIYYYKKAMENENSLAAGNLANIYIASGFEDEAKTLIDKFKGKDDVDRMINNAQESLYNTIKKEQDKKKEINDLGFKHSIFFKDYANFLLSNPKIESIKDLRWMNEDGNIVNVEIENNNLNIFWNSKNHLLSDDDHFNIIGTINHGCKIIFDCPRTVIPGLIPTYYSTDLTQKDKPYRVIDKYPGYCSIHIEKGFIKILYIKDKEVFIKEIKKSLSV